jgi:hypothetical protein
MRSAGFCDGDENVDEEDFVIAAQPLAQHAPIRLAFPQSVCTTPQRMYARHPPTRRKTRMFWSKMGIGRHANKLDTSIEPLAIVTESPRRSTAGAPYRHF